MPAGPKTGEICARGSGPQSLASSTASRADGVVVIAAFEEPDVEVSLVVPMYNEADGCLEFLSTVDALLASCATSHEIICINDGSSDDTLAKLKAARASRPRVKIVNLSRNFGKEAALTAGLDLATGRAVIPIDADFQDPPELIDTMLRRWRDGAQVVLARRTDRSSDTMVKRTTSAWFYKAFARLTRMDMTPDVGDFRLMDRVVVDALKQLPERSRFMKGLFAWVGFRQVTIDYVRASRRAGTTSFNYFKLWQFALDGFFSFSSLPLKIWSYFGFGISALAAVYMLFLILRTLVLGGDTPGYASLMCVILFSNGIILISLGVLGEYLARVFTEVKRRPLYLVNEMEGFEAPQTAGADRHGRREMA